MSPNEVLVECDNDKALVSAILGSGVNLIHHSGKVAVSRSLQNRTEPTVAMVDEDPGSIQPSYLASLKQTGLYPSHGLAMYGMRN